MFCLPNIQDTYHKTRNNCGSFLGHTLQQLGIFCTSRKLQSTLSVRLRSRSLCILVNSLDCEVC